MLVERFNEQTNLYECFDDRINWVCATGFGDTPEKARYSYFSKSLGAFKRSEFSIVCAT